MVLVSELEHRVVSFLKVADMEGSEALGRETFILLWEPRTLPCGSTLQKAPSKGVGWIILPVGELPRG